MQDTAETLQSALDDLTRRVAAWQQAQATKLYGAVAQEPPMLTEPELVFIEHIDRSVAQKAGIRLRYVEAELARLREGLKVQEGDMTDTAIMTWTEIVSLGCSDTRRMAREIQRHRALVTK